MVYSKNPGEYIPWSFPALVLQFLVSFMSFDIGATPSMAIHRLLQDARPERKVDGVESVERTRE